MTPPPIRDLIEQLRQLDVRLRLDGEELRFDAPSGVMTPELRATLRGRRDEVIEYLRRSGPPRSTTSDRIAPVDAGEPRALSFAQRQMWFLQRLLPDSTAYVLPGAIRLKGELDVAALARSLEEIQRRHHVLRTTFGWEDGAPVQQVGEVRTSDLGLTDLSHVESTARESEMREALRRWGCQSFDLETGPLFTTHLVRMDATDHVLMIAFHHIVCDGWSIGVFVHELVSLYASFRKGEASPLDELPVQYADFSAWQRDWLSGPVVERQLEYWRARLVDFPPPLELPADRRRPESPTFEGALHAFEIPPDITASVRALSRTSGATLFMALLAAFDVLLYRLTGQSDLIVGCPVAGRVRPEVEPLIGLFVNTLAMRSRVDDETTFSDLLAAVRESCLDAYEHQDLPVERLVDEIRPDRDIRYNPLYQVMFGLQSAPNGSLELPGLAVEPLEVETKGAKFDLTLSMREDGNRLAGLFEYRSELFDAGTIEQIARTFTAVLRACAADPSRPVASQTLAEDPARAAVVAGGTGAGVSGPWSAPLGGLFLASAARHGSRVAVEDGGTQWTYAVLASRACRLAGVLRAAGVGPDVRVGLWLERGAGQVAAVVGVAVSGGAYVPVEVEQPASRAAGVLADAGVRVVVTTEALAASVPAGPWQVVTLEATARGAGAGAAVEAVGTGAHLAYIVYTSGSTGRPKGVAVPQRAVTRLVWAPDYVQLGPATVMGQAATVAFDAATFEIWGTLLHGGRLVVVPTAVVVAPAALGAYVRRTGVTTLFLTTALLHQLGREAAGALAGLDTLLFGGEAVEPALVAAVQAAGAPRRLVHVYGPTETTTFATWAPVAAVAPSAVTVPIGGPIVETTVYVLDGAGAVVPAGVPGELYVGGAGLARGDRASAGLTAARFVPDHVSGASGARLYRTGDVVRWRRAGTLEFLGRRDGQVKLRGHRIELGEVEAALAGVPGVASAVATVTGTGAARQLAAYVVPTTPGAVTVAQLRAAAAARLPRYMRPGGLQLLARVPLTANGKVDRGALPAIEATASPAPVAQAPGSALERAVAAAWEQVLEVASVGVADNFFDRGGNSLLLVRVQAELETALGRSVPLVTLFEYPTVGALAAHLAGASAGARAREGVAGVPVAGPVAGPIAVIGLAGRFPGAPDVATFWARVRAGEETIRRFSAAELTAAGVPASVVADPRYVGAHGQLAGVEEFDAGLFGYTPREATLLDPQQRVFLEVVWEALERAGYAPGAPPVPVGVYAGTSANTYAAAAGRAAYAGASPLQVLVASDKDFLATRVSYKLRLTGPAVTVQTACSTSLVAVHLACQALRAGECAVAVAGGVSVRVPRGQGYWYQAEGIASPDGHCRAFDRAAAGTVAGDGVGVVVLKPLAAAEAAGDVIHAVIRGSAINNDGAGKVGFTAPSVGGQAAVVRAAQAAAGVAAATVTYVEAHGTGTALGDPVEVAALRQVFGAGAGPGSCGLGSVKTNVGHLDAAAGVTGLIKTVLALEAGEVPPSLHFEAPNPALELGPFYVPTAVRPWVAAAGAPRRAGVSSFGMGGTNAHVVVEAAPARASSTADGRPQVVVVSGQTASAVAAGAARLAAYLEATPEVALADVAYTQQVGRAALPARRAVVGTTAVGVASALRTASTHAVAGGGRAVVWLCPGQGAQQVGMGQALYATEAVFRAEVDACTAALGALEGPWQAVALTEVLYPGSSSAAAVAAGRLAETQWTQVALVVVELALARLLGSWGVVPTAVVGHSVGEVAAACVAGVLDRAGALALVAARGRLMQAAPAGGMLAVAAPEAAVAAALEPGLWLAAVNGPRQCVVAGSAAALTAGAARLAAAGVATRRLPAAGAFHSGLMAGVAAPLTAVATGVRRQAPTVPWVSSVTGAVLAAGAATDPGYWGRQVQAPVRFGASVAALAGLAEPVCVEVGPGRTLSGLVRQTAPTLVTLPGLGPGATAGADAAAQLAGLWTAGIQPDWAAYHGTARRQRVALPTYPFQRQRFWLEPSTGAEARPTVGKEPDIGRWLHRRVWRQGARIADVAPDRPRRWLLLAGESTLGARVIEHLRERDEAVVIVEEGDSFEARGAGRYRLRPGSQADYDELVRCLGRDDTSLPTDVLHLWGVTTDQVGESSASDVAEVEARCFYSVLYLVRALTGHASSHSIRLAVATNHVQAVTGDEPLCPTKAVALGPCLVIPQEFDGVSAAHVDLVLSPEDGRQREIAGMLLDEVRGGLPDRVVALRGRRRWVPAVERIEASTAGSQRLPLREKGVYLVTGGLGGIGLALAEVLADTVSARLVLVGRRELPPRETWKGRVTGVDVAVDRVIRRVQHLESLGAEVLIARADVSRPEELEPVLVEARRRFGTIAGVVHAAGVAGDGTIGLKTDDAAARVLAPKVAGTLGIERLLANDPLDFMLLCSSLTGLVGGLGQVDYCAANAFLDAFAQARWARGDSHVVSVDWDTWREVGMAVETEGPAELAHHREQAESTAMTVSEGQEVFRRVLTLSEPQVAVCTHDLVGFVQAMDRARPRQRTDRLAREDSPGPAQGPRPALATVYEEPVTEIERAVCGAFEQSLGIAPVGVNDSFFELGGHSLVAMDVMSDLNERFGTSVPVAGLYEGLTPGAVAMLFDTSTDERGRSVGVASSTRKKRERRESSAPRRRGARLERSRRT